MEQIEIIHSMKRAYRWLSSGVALPLPYDEALNRVARGLAREVAG